MSRSGYSDDNDEWGYICWRGAVNSASKGARGQQFFKDLLVALDDLDVSELITNSLETEGSFCALGALGKHRGLDMSNLHPEESEEIAGAFNIANALVCEVVYVNDEWWLAETPTERFHRVRAWVSSQINFKE